MEDEIKRNSAGLPVRTLGRSGEEVSIIGLGGGHLARSAVPRDLSVKIIQTAVDEGITFFDTAWEYWEGESEKRVGLGLEGRRDKVFLMTKVCARDREGAEQQLHESLTRLRTDVIDLWQLHEINYDNDPDWIFAPGGVLEAAVKAREAGKIRFIGFTGHKSPHIFHKMLEQDFEWDSCQMPITVMDAHYRSFQREILPELNRRGIAALGMKSLGGDAQMVKNAGLTPQQCRRYALSLPITTLITGVQSLENLRQDVEIARTFTPMSAEERESLIEKVRPEAGDGRHEWFKSTQYYDSSYHRDQHSFPPVGTVHGR